ncbi:hypothetical protein FA13DRAFT_1843923 [Coprinellus micaceus]|uniref:Uncharacterized protein n=1 Tax=Coprinellus micaceus TaxID=71717 RepID=A0A4Y7SDU1_COPMI|nr:hypothetical protein FA13DRAFT_1843923 [Coprinellus micaceus]
MLVFVPASQEDSLPMMTHVARSLETFHSNFEEALNSASLGNAAWLIPDGSILERDNGSLSGSVEALLSPHRLHGVFEGVSGSCNLYAVRYSINIEGTRESHHWFDYIGLFEPGEMDCEIDSIFLRYPPLKLKIPLALPSRRNCDKRGSAMGTSQGQRHNRTAVVGRDSDRESRNIRVAWRSAFEGNQTNGTGRMTKHFRLKGDKMRRGSRRTWLDSYFVRKGRATYAGDAGRSPYSKGDLCHRLLGSECLSKGDAISEGRGSASFSGVVVASIKPIFRKKAPSELPFRYTFASAQQGTATSRNSPFIPSMGRRGGIGIVETNGLGADGTRAERELHGSGILEEPRPSRQREAIWPREGPQGIARRPSLVVGARQNALELSR